MTSPRVRLVVLFGGRSAEHEVSCVSAASVLRAVDPDRYDTVPVGITHDGSWVVADEAIAALERGAAALPVQLTAAGTEVEPLDAVQPGRRPSASGSPAAERSLRSEAISTVVLPILHGPHGEDGTVQGMLELAGVPYVATGVLGSALAMDKAKAKEVLAYHGLPQCRWLAWRDSEVPPPASAVATVTRELGWPVFVKPSNLGSSVGVTKVSGPEGLAAALTEALAYDEWVLVEEAVDGREIEVAVLGNTEPEASVPGEIRPTREFYDYEDKYGEDSAALDVPADLPDEVAEEARSLAIQVFKALRGDGMARVDFFYEEGGRGLLVNEMNTMPGFTPKSMYPMMWEASGLPYAKLIDRLVELALERHAHRSSRVGRARR